MKWKNVNLEEKIINVKETIERVYIKKENKTTVIIGEPKSISSIRRIPINNKLYGILKNMKKRSEPESFVLTGSCTQFATNCIEVGMDII